MLFGTHSHSSRADVAIFRSNFSGEARADLRVCHLLDPLDVVLKP